MKVQEERDRLEGLLDTASDTIMGNIPIPGDIPTELRGEPTMGVNFAELRVTCEGEARIMLNNAIGFILPTEMILDNEYLKNKLEVDIMSLSGILYQLRISEVMQVALMNEVDRGLTNPRMFEVFSGLSKTIADINKQLLGTVEAIKSTYKDIKNDVNEKRTDALGTSQSGNNMLTSGDGGIVTLGTKELINKLKKEQSENAQFIHDAELIQPEQ